MSKNKEHHYSKKRIFSFVLVPEHDGSNPKTWRLSLFKLLTIIIFSTSFFIFMLIFMLRTTPLQRFLPVTQDELERRYGKQIYALRDELQVLQKEFISIQDYNDKLRNALGIEKNKKTTNRTILIEENNNFDFKPNGAITTYSANNNQAQFDFPFSPPVKGFQTNEYIPSELHFGIDFSAKKGTVISAVRDGKVIFSDYTERDGNVIMISHQNGFVSIYKHNQVLLKKINQKVLQGESIALLGNTGVSSSGPHLHFELWQNGVPLNPAEFMIMNNNIFAKND
ncbi:MAG: M23 family metallopeptidase [Bacteroidetes bacterium]|nr:M23 family metallopeptidase [Bacteroidota bacterium]